MHPTKVKWYPKCRSQGQHNSNIHRLQFRHLPWKLLKACGTSFQVTFQTNIMGQTSRNLMVVGKFDDFEIWKIWIDARMVGCTTPHLWRNLLFLSMLSAKSALEHHMLNLYWLHFKFPGPYHANNLSTEVTEYRYMTNFRGWSSVYQEGNPSGDVARGLKSSSDTDMPMYG